MGSDAFQGIERWHQWQRLVELAHLVVMYRPGCTLPSLSVWARERLVERAADFNERAAGGLLFQKVTPQSISGTGLRAALARHEDVQVWLPPPVWDYIRQHHLYPGT